MFQFHVILLAVAGLFCPAMSHGSAASPDKPTKRVLLLGQKPDRHPWSTHEYMAGVNLMAACLQPFDNLQTIVVQADDPWQDGPELIDGADAVVVFVSEGAKWIGQDAQRLAAFQRLAKRGGGFVCLHWGMGCKEAKYIEDFVNLFGGCHGGPDRKYKFLTTTLKPVSGPHAVVRGVTSLEIREEFYYRLKFPKGEDVTPLLRAAIENESHTVSWAWERPNGGRSFGFSGGHFHENWKHEQYRRLMTQAVLWTLHQPIPETGVNVDIPKAQLRLKPRPDAQKKK